MFAEKTDKLVDELVRAEYENAVKQYGEKYESKYKAFCVLQEEILEAWNEADFLNEHIVPRVLNAINEDDNDIRLKCYIRDVIKASKLAIKELAQVCAVCEKFKATMNTKGEE